MAGFEIKVKKLTDGAKLPEYKTENAVGADLTATWRKMDEDGNMVYGTGLAMEIPVGYAGLLFPRSSIAETGQHLTNCVGVIDPDYRGEVKAKFKYIAEGKEYVPGDRICQLIVVEAPRITYMEAEELSETKRGTGGYGSTNKK